MLILGLLTHILFISNIILHHAPCLSLLVFQILCSHRFFSYEMTMCSLEKKHLKISIIIIIGHLVLCALFCAEDTLHLPLVLRNGTSP